MRINVVFIESVFLSQISLITIYKSTVYRTLYIELDSLVATIVSIPQPGPRDSPILVAVLVQPGVVLCSDPSVSQPVFTITENAPTRALSWLKVESAY